MLVCASQEVMSNDWPVAVETKDLAATINSRQVPSDSTPLASEVKVLSTKQPVTKHTRKLLRSSSSPSGPAAGQEQSEKQRLGQLAQTQEQRRDLLDKVCAVHHLDGRQQVLQRHVSRLFVEERYRLLYCEVPKVGCSNWKRVLMVLAGSAASAADISHDMAHSTKQLRLLSGYNRTEMERRLASYTKVLFVREPFERLVSAFRDKFENPNPYYHPLFGRAIIGKYRVNASEDALRTGDGVTFEEFVQYLLDERRPVGMDTHWQPVSQLCNPCHLHYDLLGKFESMKEDADFVLHSIGAPQDLTLPDLKDRNPRDKRTSTTITQQYFAQLSHNQRQRVYDLYRLDYLMFNYSKPLKILE